MGRGERKKDRRITESKDLGVCVVDTTGEENVRLHRGVKGVILSRFMRDIEARQRGNNG